MREIEVVDCDGSCREGRAVTTARERRRFLRQVLAGFAAGALTLGCLAGIDASGITVSVSASGSGGRTPLSAS